MRPRYFLRAIAFLTGLSGVLSAQVTLNRTPSRALGHPTLIATTRNPNLVEGRELYAPQSLALDTTVSPPVLYVSDLLNNRVLGWKNALSFSNGTKADIVVGQKDFLSTQALGPGSPFSSGLAFPTGVAVDRNGNLYVVDGGNNRILRFPKPYAQTDQLPDLVIGQVSLNCSACNQANSGGISAKTIKVAGLTATLLFDTQGNLWFTDSGNNRVLRYPVSTLGANASNQPAADLVLGQLDFTTNTLPQLQQADLLASKSVLYQPNGLIFDPTGRLYVSDSTDRVLVYQPNLSPSTFDSGRAALRIMGIVQVPKVPNPPPTPIINGVQFSNPQGLFMVGNTPGVVDANHHRLMLFDPFEQWPADGSSPNARNVVGQSSFQGSGVSTNFGMSNRGLAEPRSISFNFPTFALATSNELFVADAGNNRVLVFPTSGLGPNSSATRVLGQDDFTFGAPNLLEGREMDFSLVGGDANGGVLVDTVASVPHLYIADANNNRVLGFFDARKVRPGDKADLVIGQPDFQRGLINYPTNDASKPSAQSLYLPVGLALDTDGNLFVADTGNGRVLRFPKPFDQAPANFPSADLVLGQSGFNGSVTDPTQRTMHSPYGLAFTSDGGLLVSDSFHNRVLFFTGRNFVNGQSASKVFGQPDFASFAAGTDTNQLSGPKHIATDSDDRLYVMDEANNRLLIFDGTPAASATNARAATVLTGPSPGNGFFQPRGVFVSQLTGEIWTTELNANRLLRFPKFDDLGFQQNASNFQIQSNAAVAIAQDTFGDLFVAEFTNRVAIYYPGLTAVNAANALQKALAPGAITTVNRQGAPFTDNNTDADPANWPMELADVQVMVANSPAPISTVKPDSLTFLMPMSTPTSGSVEVQVVRKSTGQILGAGQVDMAVASPALFTLNDFGVGQLRANNDDGLPNGPTHAIGRGKVISLFGTGQGYVPGAPPDGQAPSDPIQTDLKPRVLIGTQFVDPSFVMYSGLAPGQVGVWQIDVKIPDFVAPAQMQTIAVSQQ